MSILTLLFNDINGYVHKVLELKISLILRVHCSDVQREVLGEGQCKKAMHVQLFIERIRI